MNINWGALLLVAVATITAAIAIVGLFSLGVAALTSAQRSRGGPAATLPTVAGYACLTAQPGPSGTGAPDVTAPGWSVGGPELDNAWQRVTRLLHDHPAGLHSAPLSRAVFSQIGSDGSCPEETPTDYRHFNRWDDAWVSVLLPRRPG